MFHSLEQKDCERKALFELCKAQTVTTLVNCGFELEADCFPRLVEKRYADKKYLDFASLLTKNT
jgi:hypothetical protein